MASFNDKSLKPAGILPAWWISPWKKLTLETRDAEHRIIREIAVGVLVGLAMVGILLPLMSLLLTRRLESAAWTWRDVLSALGVATGCGVGIWVAAKVLPDMRSWGIKELPRLGDPFVRHSKWVPAALLLLGLGFFVMHSYRHREAFHECLMEGDRSACRKFEHNAVELGFFLWLFLWMRSEGAAILPNGIRFSRLNGTALVPFSDIAHCDVRIRALGDGLRFNLKRGGARRIVGDLEGLEDFVRDLERRVEVRFV